MLLVRPGAPHALDGHEPGGQTYCFQMSQDFVSVLMTEEYEYGGDEDRDFKMMLCSSTSHLVADQ